MFLKRANVGKILKRAGVNFLKNQGGASWIPMLSKSTQVSASW